MPEYVAAFFSHNGSPSTGLSPSLDIYDVATKSVVVQDGAMDEIGGGFYRYDFTLYQSGKNYAVVCDGGSTLSGAERYAVGFYGPPDPTREYLRSRDLVRKIEKKA